MTDTTASQSASPASGPDADRTLVIERLFRASPDRVFAAWTDPSIMVQWWGPEGHHVPEYDMDVREGGQYRAVMQSEKGERHTVSGTFRRIDPPSHLTLTWAWEQPDGTRGHETVIDLTFVPDPDGTRLTLVQRLFETTEGRDNHRKGWMSMLNCLDAALPT